MRSSGRRVKTVSQPKPEKRISIFALLKRILLTAIATLTGLLLFGASAADWTWQTLGMLDFLLAGIAILFSTRDLVHLGLQRLGIPTAKDAVFTHLCAALMLLLALAFGGNDDPHGI
jgi:hypothetical protein